MTDYDVIYWPDHNEWYLYVEGQHVATFNTLSSLEAYCSEEEPVIRKSDEGLAEIKRRCDREVGQ